MKKLFLFYPLIAVILLLIASCATATVKNHYEIGETGTGGGIVFFTEGGTYMECSLGLGRPNWDDAQKIIKKYRGGKKKDWRLPTVDELELIYKNLKLQELGRLSVDKYWSSLQDNADYAWVFDFSQGTRETYKKSYICSVRAVRSFNLNDGK